mmetsp:Transcript_29905/g.92579  ORF Transcript_29905/g.92579 Transcript_29905/m.92579 type:complete len:512 (+) Transcript_29905:1189-2724(+)
MQRHRLLAALAASTAAAVELWPLPRSLTNGSDSLIVIPGPTFFRLAGPASESDVLVEGIARYADLTFPHRFEPGVGLSELVVDVDNATQYPALGDDESYSLEISGPQTATLKAPTVWGALRGLETFSQLVEFDFDARGYKVHDAPLSIQDAPRFPHRGLMVDSGRHFEPVAAIKKIVDSLPYAKLNVLHWHAVDTQSFPIETPSRPKLWEGAYSKAERYSTEDVQDVVEHARLRGVRVMVEFDVPGHSESWCAGYPEVCPSTTCDQPLDVSSDATFELIDAILGDAAAVFPDQFVHLGGDEVNTDCWDSTPHVKDWLDARNMSADDGYAYFVKTAGDLARGHGKRVVQWSEVFDHFKTDLDKTTIVHVWKSVTNVTEVLADGYDVLLNVGYDETSWYLDNLDVTWDKVYAQEPCAGVPDDLCPRILGGHGEMWGETVDASDLEQTVWPRMAAIAERLWSERSVADVAEAKPRLEVFRCLLESRGIAAAPVNNTEARDAPPGPDSCYAQRRR